MRREGASQQLGLEIVRPRCLGAEKDVVLATLGQSYVALEGDGMVGVEVTVNMVNMEAFVFGGYPS